MGKTKLEVKTMEIFEKISLTSEFGKVSEFGKCLANLARL